MSLINRVSATDVLLSRVDKENTGLPGRRGELGGNGIGLGDSLTA